jgi:hypothetical protein
LGGSKLPCHQPHDAFGEGIIFYRVDSLHSDRVICEACATVIGAVTLDPDNMPLGALRSADAAAEWLHLADAFLAHETVCRPRTEPAADEGGGALPGRAGAVSRRRESVSFAPAVCYRERSPHRPNARDTQGRSQARSVIR